ncbi:OmpP1/FadL family transporter [Desulfoluna spongiiphila]|uniref:OmpP1/FadL family transporter n=1 Tax=Desulfoluna spongiiphila TaxID=419481 RepID=UPI001256B854|nr:hypothetical protein [Desulfoluna spongiiphila]VVS90649.1 hypothetical protein DBB_2160 [Desulfoluna spongiiphila]
MKGFVLRVGAGFFAALLISSSAMASMVDNQSSLTADFTRMPARTAASDASDASIFNPAGSAWLEEGLHVGVSFKACFKDWQHSRNGETFEADNANFLPPFHSVYRNGRLGLYAAVTAFGGMGKADYDDGFTLGSMPVVHPIAGPMMVDLTFRDKAEFTYVVPGLTTGVSWLLSDSFAVSGGFRVLHGIMEVEIDEGEQLDASMDATGGAPVFGLSWRATDKLDISLRHEMRTKMEYEVDKVEGSHPLVSLVKGVVKEGSKMRRDFPAQTAMGVMYRIAPKWRVAVDGAMAWQKDADRGGEEKGMGNGYYVASGVECDVTPKWTLGAGYIYCDPKDDRDRFPYLTVNPKLKYQVVSAGVKYRYSDTLSLSFSVAPYFYDSCTTPQGIKMEKKTLDVAFGVEWLLK